MDEEAVAAAATASAASPAVGRRFLTLNQQLELAETHYQVSESELFLSEHRKREPVGKAQTTKAKENGVREGRHTKTVSWAEDGRVPSFRMSCCSSLRSAVFQEKGSQEAHNALRA